jgi:hypothetical protein
LELATFALAHEKQGGNPTLASAAMQDATLGRALQDFPAHSRPACWKARCADHALPAKMEEVGTTARLPEPASPFPVYGYDRPALDYLSSVST